MSTTAATAQVTTTPQCDWHWWSWGEGPPLLCLHGFPDTAASFDELVPELVAAGWRVIVPAMPGYAPGGPMKDGDYQTINIARAMLDWLDLLGIDSCCVLGHDWGAVTAYALANLAPRRVRRVVCAAVPHPRRMLRPTPRQLRRSWYMGFFQLPRWPEQRLAQTDGAFLRRLWRDWSPGWAFSEAQLAPVLENFSRPASRSAALAYYRALPAAALHPDFKRAIAPLAVPALLIAGADDGCIGAEMFRQQDHLFAAGYQLEVLPATGHFMHREVPQAFLAAVLPFLAEERNRG